MKASVLKLTALLLPALALTVAVRCSRILVGRTPTQLEAISPKPPLLDTASPATAATSGSSRVRPRS